MASPLEIPGNSFDPRSLTIFLMKYTFCGFDFHIIREIMLSNLLGYISIHEKNNERKKFKSTDCSCLAKLKIGTVKTSKPQLQLKDS